MIDIPKEWLDLNFDGLSGVLMVIGASDTGKSTFSQYLYQHLVSLGRPVAFLDGDPGQSRLGPPTTMTLACALPEDQRFPPAGRQWRCFVGSTSPAGHMLNVLVGAARLVEAASIARYQTVVYDTSGLIDPSLGGYSLKLAKIDLLKPTLVFALEHENELQALINPLQRSGRARVIELHSSNASRLRSQAIRQEHRQGMYARYFKGSHHLTVNWSSLPVLPAPRFRVNCLVALEYSDGFVSGLGLVKDIDRGKRQATLLTPLKSLEKVAVITLGDVILDPETFEDRRTKF